MISFKLISDSIFSPKVAFQRIVTFEIKVSVLVEATIFIALVNAIFSYISNYLLYSNNVEEENLFFFYYENILSKPLLLVFLEIFKILFITTVITYTGRLFGGKGSFINLLKSVVWIHFILVFINFLIFVSIYLNINITGYLIILANIWIIWVLSECAARAHGFKSTFLVFVFGLIILIVIMVLILQVLNSNDFIFLERVSSNA